MSVGDAHGIKVLCPFYREAGRTRLRCEGPFSDVWLAVLFNTPDDCKAYFSLYCKSKLFCKCPVYEGLMKFKYPER